MYKTSCLHTPLYTIQAEDYSDSHESRLSPVSLQTLCLIAAIDNLEYYPHELLACVPLVQRYQLLAHCPIIDVCHLEKTSVFDNINLEKLWSCICDKLWKRARFEFYCESDTNGEMFTENRYKEMLKTNAPSREKCFVLLTTAILCAERPTGLFCDSHYYPCTKDNMPQEWFRNNCPADVVNYLVCTDNLKVQGQEKTLGGNDDFYYATAQKSFPLEYDVEDLPSVSIEYISVAYYGNQHFPPRYMHLTKDKNYLGNEDAITLLMDECNYYPDNITLHGFESIEWSRTKEEVECMLTKFLCTLKEVNLYVGLEWRMTDYANTILTCSFRSSVLSAAFVDFSGDATDLVTPYFTSCHPCVKQLSLEKLGISKFDLATTDRQKVLTEILACHSDICELKLDNLHGEIPNDPDLIHCIVAIMQNSNFVRLSLKRVHLSVKFAVEMLTAYLVTPCSHSQEIHMRDIKFLGDDIGLPPSTQLVPDESALEFKSLLWSHKISDKSHSIKIFCDFVLSFRPLLLHNLRIKVGPSSDILQVSHMLQVMAENTSLKVHSLSLNDWNKSHFGEEHLEAILMCTSLKRLHLGYVISRQSLACLTNAFRVQIQQATLEHLSIETGYAGVIDVEPFFSMIFTLPQVSQLSLHFVCLISNDDVSEVTEALHQIWLKYGGKKLRKFHFLYTDRISIISKYSEHLHAIDTTEMQLME